MNDQNNTEKSTHAKHRALAKQIFQQVSPSNQPPLVVLSPHQPHKPAIKTSKPKPTDDDDDVLTEDDIEQLTQQGFDEASIEAVAQAVNEQLSSNANEDEDEDEDKKDEPTNTERDTSPAPSDQPTAKRALSREDIDQDINTEVTKQLKAQQEEQYEAFKQFLAKKHSEQAIDYRQVRLNIESGALPTRTFYLLNGLAAVIAGFGLLANSPAVVIGAMLVAMLMGPISGIALAIIDARFALLKKSLFTLATGGLLIYAIGMVLGWLHPEQALSQEIISRTAPNTMDVVVALAGGTAGAYAMISPNLPVAVVGVAVATALVPPLTASGILLATGQYRLALGALVLTLTNILAIQFTNALVLWVAGFRRLDVDEEQDEKAKGSKWRQTLLFIRRNAVSLTLLIIISIYLAMNFQHKIRQQNYEAAVRNIIEQGIADQPNYVVSTSFDISEKKAGLSQTPDDPTDTTPTPAVKPYLIRVVLQGLVPPSYQDVRDMEQQIIALSHERYPKRPPAKLQVRFVPEQVIETTPVTKDDIKLDPASLNQLKDNKQ